MSDATTNHDTPGSGRHILMLLDNPCDPDPRVDREAKALSDAGFQVTILAWNRTGKNPTDEYRDGYRIVRLPPTTGRHLGWKQMLYLQRFYEKALAQLDRIEADVVYAHDFLMLPLAVMCARNLGARLVYDAHEIYRYMDSGRLPGVWLKAAAKLENFLIDRCVDLFITVSEQRRRDYWQGCVRKNPVIVGNWYDGLEVDRASVRQRYGLSDALTVGYAGTLSEIRRIDLLVELAELRPDIQVAVAGRGSPETVAMVENAGGRLDNFHYLGWVDDSSELLGACDAIYYALDPSHPYSAYAAPNTLFTAIACSRPLLAIGGGEIDLLREISNGVLTVDGLSGEGLIQAVDRLDRDCEYWGEARSNYTWQAAERTLVQAVSELLQ